MAVAVLGERLELMVLEGFSKLNGSVRTESMLFYAGRDHHILDELQDVTAT